MYFFIDVCDLHIGFHGIKVKVKFFDAELKLGQFRGNNHQCLPLPLCVTLTLLPDILQIPLYSLWFDFRIEGS